jgi:hypothetical protein
VGGDANTAQAGQTVLQYGYIAAMKATIEIPDDLYRKVKAKSALEGRTVRAVTIELFEGWLKDARPSADVAARTQWLDNLLRVANDISRDAPPGPTATEILATDRNRLERGEER